MSDHTAIEWSEGLRTRFWANVDRSGPTAPGMDSPCWMWTAGTFSNGYGQFRAGQRKVRAHRAAYELAVGPVPEGLILRHQCDVRQCCRPDHLTPGTDAENARDRDDRGRTARLGTSLPGETNPAAKLSDAEVERLRLFRLHGGLSYRRLGVLFGICTSQARNIVLGTSRTRAA